MGSLKSRLERADRKSRVGHGAASGARALRTIAQAMVEQLPGIELVEPEDTDSDTYASLQEILMKARGRFHEAAVWRQRAAPPRAWEHLDQLEPADKINAIAEWAMGPEVEEAQRKQAEACRRALERRRGHA